MADGLLNKASIILTPTGYKAGTLYNVAPIDEPYEDFDFARTSTATRINSSGLVSNVATGVPRISYDSNGENGHILLEPTTTNLVTYSQDINSLVNSTGQIGGNTTLTYENDVVAPDGSLGVYRIQMPDTSGTYLRVTGSVVSQSMSVWVKAKTVGTNNQFTLYRDGASDIKTATGDWQRFEYSWSNNNSGIYYINNDGDTYTSDLYVWGIQVENLSYATSYIPTLTGSTETRATETATGAGSADLINSTEGVLYAEIAKVQDDNDNYILISLNNAASNSDENSVAIGFDNSDDFYVRLKSGNSDILKSDGQNATANNFHKIAIRYKSGDSAIYINGSEATYSVGDGTATFSFAVTLDNLSFDYDGNSGLPFYGKCKALAVFNEALSDDELHNLTG